MDCGKNPELVTLGETMVSLIPAASGPLRYVQSFYNRIAGAESNLAIGLAKLGHTVAWVSRLGDDEFGQFLRNQIRAEGVDLSGVVFDPDHRTGLMVKEMSAGETKVFYYRENSAASHLCPEDLPDDMLRGVKIAHLTGITPVLSDSCRATVTRMMDLADASGTKISFDPNIRRRLWKDTDYAPLIRELTMRSHYVLLGLDEAEAILGTNVPEEIFDILLADGARPEAVAIKNGAEGSWVATREVRRHIDPIPVKCIEPVGAGDGFNAGFLSGMLQGKDVELCGRMGNVAGGLATQGTGDFENYPSREKMEAMLAHAKEIYR